VVTLHIEHEITDFEVWKSAFNRFGETRIQAGVRAERILRPVSNPHYIVIHLDFDTSAKAEEFQAFLKEKVWGIKENSPGLASAPKTLILEPNLLD
jgi:hypothetical protein